MNKQHTLHIIVASLLVVAAALSRVLMYPDNFSPIIGMALFSGAILPNKKLAFAMPLLAMFLSDVLFEVFSIAPGFWGWGQLAGYAILALITVFAFTLKKPRILNLAIYSLTASVIFFVLSNLSYFLIENPIYGTYPQDGKGLMSCYVAALPFFRTAIFADLVYTFALFGVYQLYCSQVAKRTITA